MKKILFSFLICLLGGMSLFAQNGESSYLYVEKFSITDPVNVCVPPKGVKERDINNRPWAQVKIVAKNFNDKLLKDIRFSSSSTVVFAQGAKFDEETGCVNIVLSAEVNNGRLIMTYAGRELEYRFPEPLVAKRVYRMELSMRSANLTIMATPDGAAITIDGERQSKKGVVTKSLPLGSHTYSVTCDGYVPANKSITLNGDMTVNEELQPTFGYLSVNSSPQGAEVYINNKKAGTTPINKVKVDRGKSIMELRLTTYNEHSQTIDVKAGDILNLGTIELKRDAHAVDAYFVMTVTPANATVYIDDIMREVADGEVMIVLPYGRHNYRVEAAGYVAKTGNFDMGTTRKELDVQLVSAKATLTLNCNDNKADIYVNSEKRGTGSWTGQLNPGMYVVEARKEGHRTQTMSVTLAQQERKTLTLNAPQPVYGSLNLMSSPANCTVYLDGKQIGKSPDIFTKVLAGTHEVELRKDGYTSKKQNVTINEDRTAELNMKLEKVQQQTASNSGSYGSANAGNNQTFTVNGVSFEMVAVKGGTFTMGSTDQYADSDEKITHSVTVSDFMIGKFEVTQALWKAVMGTNPSRFKGDNLPVEQVSWNDAQEFIRKLNQLTGQNFRLPTEAEWEYAARGGTNTSLYNGENINIRGVNNSPNLDKLAWYGGNCGQNYTSYAGCDVSNGYDISGWSEKQYNDSKGGTHPVGLKQPNAYGLYDMLGNVWEWCSDWYGDYSRGSQTNPTGPSSGSSRVLRGGSWINGARYCRVSNRGDGTPDSRLNYRGFRLVLPQ